MGIKGLWSVLTPFSEKKSLHEIRGETIAVDLSGWVCDSQNVTDYHIQPKLYLRNLFFRTVYLLMADINPVFVLEGEAPELKKDTMAARNAIQFKGSAPKRRDNDKKKCNTSRKRFSNVLKECESLLKCMGVACVKAKGEAEATCAFLNAQGLVDAVVSQDSDCFAYGALRVYRNFSVSNAAGAGAMQGSIECYDADKMIKQNGFGRNKMVALALLCGCDYSAGACGSATGTVLAFLHTIDDCDIINRLKSWVNDPDKYAEQQRLLSSNCCDKCGHAGRTHAKKGCIICLTTRGCNDNGYKAKMSEVKKELSLRSKALSSGIPFPEARIMSEFLQNLSEDIGRHQLKISAPSLIQFVKLMGYKLEWSERYCVEKFLPVLTRWHLQDDVTHRTLAPQAIIKKRHPKGVPSYEVIWSDIKGQYTGLIPDDQYDDNEDPTKSWTTIERQDLMAMYYPDVVNSYEESIKKPVKEKKTRSRKKKEVDEPDKPKQEKPKRKYTKKKDKECTANSIINLSKSNKKANVSVKVNKLKRPRTNIKKNQKTVHSFLTKRKKSVISLVDSLRMSFHHISLNDSITKHLDENKENAIENKSFNLLDLSDDDVPDSDLSDIVDKIVNKAPTTKTATLNNNLVRLVFTKRNTPRKSGFHKGILNEININSSTPRSSPARKRSLYKSANLSNCQASTSLFFDKLTDECDAFELSLDYKPEVDNDETVNYDLSDLPYIKV